MTDASGPARARPRDGIAVVAVLYFLVVSALTIAAALFAHRSLRRDAEASSASARLLAAAEGAAYDVLGDWDGSARDGQLLGTTTASSATERATTVSVYVTRLDVSTYSIVADARVSTGIARRVELLVRVCGDTNSAGGVGQGVLLDPTASRVASNEIMLTQATPSRYSGCDARHGVASSLQSRRVRDRAFAELF